jgi:chorismate synthase
MTFAVLDNGVADKMRTAILDAASDGDSVGGVLETAVVGMPAGVGEPWFDTLEGMISHIMFSIPAIKGIEFGAGFPIADMHGSNANDQMQIENGKVVTLTNNNGGINGGISNGMPIIFQVAIKPTPSITTPQQTVNLKTGEITSIEVKGRHDPCIVPRAVPVVEAAAAIAIYDLILGNTQTSRRR